VTAFTSDRTLSFCFDGLRETPKPFKAGLPQGFPASPILFLIYANTIMNPTIPMNGHLESECTYIGNISMVQAATKTDNAIFRLKTRSEIQIDHAKILHIRYSPVKSELMFCFPTGSAFKSIEPDDHPALVINNQRISPKCSLKYLGIYLDESLTFKHALTAAATGLKHLGSVKFLRMKT
jgi:hypothetical protein